MKLKQILCTICIIFGITTVANAFTDLPSTHWAYNDVQKMADEGIVSGYNDGSFKPEKNVTNEEFATILTKVVGLKADLNPIKFEDVAEDRWSKPYIDAMSKHYTYKTTKGKNYFDPFGAATREEVAVAVVRAKGLEGQTPDYTVLEKFSDKNEINPNLKSYIAIAVKNGIMNGNANGTFRPKGNLTRAQIASLMNNVKNKNVVVDQGISVVQAPTMLEKDTWYKGNTEKETITKVTFVDSYKPTGNEIESWNADVEEKGTIKCYIIGTELIIAGNGSGKIYANEDSSKMFKDFSKLMKLDILNLDVSNVKIMERMFSGCNSLQELDVSNWDVSSVTNMEWMFGDYIIGCQSLKEIDVSNWNVTNVNNMRGMFASCNSLQELDVSNWNVTNVNNMSSMFASCGSLQELDVSNWNVSKVTDMQEMFRSCRSLEKLDVSKWNTSNVIIMKELFAACSALKEIDVSKWNTSNATHINWMFSDCHSLMNIDVSKWNTSNVTYMTGMFNNCISLEKIYISNLNTNKVIYMDSVFENCKLLQELNISDWDTRNVIDMSEMFSHCNSLEKIDISKWNVSKVTDMRQMFYSCSKLKELDISNWGNSNEEKSIADMFEGCTSLKTLKVGKNEYSGLPESVTIIRE